MGTVGQAGAMKVERRCEVCSGPAEPHHVVSRGAGGTDEPWNVLYLCRRCHRYYHDAGWVKFADYYPALRAKILEARRTSGKHVDEREGR